MPFLVKLKKKHSKDSIYLHLVKLSTHFVLLARTKTAAGSFVCLWICTFQQQHSYE